MMNNKGTLLILLFLCISCSAAPKLRVNTTDFEPPPPDTFSFTFLDDSCRMVHSIEARFGSRNMHVLGITVADPVQRTLDSAILTIEGLVVFEARYANNEVTVKRSLDIFNSPDFAMAMMNDIMLIFFPPEYSERTTGYDSSNNMICRYLTENSMLDIVLDDHKSWTKKLYRDKKLIKKITAGELTARGLAQELVLESRGDTDYTLHLRLIEAETAK